MLSVNASNHLYACGSGGFAVRRDGASWTVLQIPTNIDLNVVFCCSDGRVFLAAG